ncbi:Zn-ribbon domain-containing OB-fold protein [Nocardia miyunensis]|uniref:Zn-ribbon domain-containing OB-fold protein n=1 Tax=Nocardia miyunensis TaxID=282684 RepID=UPI0008365E28|nr:OB-fold domain-containing protein [Nocardia miyunensis]
MSKQIPLAPGLFTWPADEPALLGGRCASCGHVAFPVGKYCLACGHADVAAIELPRRGRLWTFTTQQFRPPAPPYAGADSPETFMPYGVGYVELPGACKVESRLTEADPAALSIGQEMELVVVPFGTAPDGNQTVTFAFRPV